MNTFEASNSPDLAKAQEIGAELAFDKKLLKELEQQAIATSKLSLQENQEAGVDKHLEAMRNYVKAAITLNGQELPGLKVERVAL